MMICHVGSGVKFVGCCVFQAEDGIRDLVRSRGLGDVYKRQFQVFPSGRRRYGNPAGFAGQGGGG